MLNSTRNPGLDQKWSTLDQKWSNLDQIWSTLDQNGPTPKYFFDISAQDFLPKIIEGPEKCFMNFNSFMHFQVGPEVVQGGPDLLQPGI